MTNRALTFVVYLTVLAVVLGLVGCDTEAVEVSPESKEGVQETEQMPESGEEAAEEVEARASICFYWTSNNNTPICTSLDTLYRFFPVDAPSISSDLLTILLEHSGLNELPENEAELLEILASDDIFAGCANTGEGSGAVRLGDAHGHPLIDANLLVWRLDATASDEDRAACGDAGSPENTLSLTAGLLADIMNAGSRLDASYDELYIGNMESCTESGGTGGQPPPVEGGDDTGTSDSGTTDSGTSDSGTTDSGTSDSGTTDSGTSDSGTTDSGTSDSGTTDSGTSDSGTTDSGTSDSGTTDGSTTDGGTTDGGTTDGGTSGSGGTTTKKPDSWKVIVGKIWDVISGGGGKDDDTNSATTGVRGDCLPDAMDCSVAQTCHTQSQSAAFEEAVLEFEYDGCGINWTPNPDQPDPCSDDAPLLSWLWIYGSGLVETCKQDWISAVDPDSYQSICDFDPNQLVDAAPWWEDPCSAPDVTCLP